MANIDLAAMKAKLEVKSEKFHQAVIESFWSEHGELIYVLKDGICLVEYASLLKFISNIAGTFDNSTHIKLMHSDSTHFESFITSAHRQEITV